LGLNQIFIKLQINFQNLKGFQI